MNYRSEYPQQEVLSNPCDVAIQGLSLQNKGSVTYQKQMGGTLGACVVAIQRDMNTKI